MDGLQAHERTRAYQHFIQHTPKRPRATDRLGQNAPYMQKRAALECANIQLQPAEMRGSIAADMDQGTALSIVLEMDFPRPQLIMVNPENGHAHPIWQLEDAVPFGQNFRRKPQTAFMDLQRQVTLLYSADPGYGHYMVKTPGHSRWETLVHDVAPYSLSELFEAMPAGIAKQASAKAGRVQHGEGRHQTLFDIGRLWAYGEIKRAVKRGQTLEQWKLTVTAEFLNLNAFAEPLPASQVRSLARRVAQYCWDNTDRLNGSVLDGEKRSLTKSWQREAVEPEYAKARMQQGALYTNAARRNKSEDAVFQALATLAGQGITSPNISQLAVLSGVSRPTVRAVLGRQGQGPIGGN